MRLEEEAAAASPRRAALVRYELGRLLAARAEDRQRALEVFRQGADFAPSARAVTRFHVRSGEAAELIPALEAEERATEDTETRAAILVERALVRLTETGDEELALEELFRALELVPGQAVALEALAERLIKGERAEELELLYREQADACGDEARGAELLFLAGRVRERDLEDPDQAQALYRAALLADADHDRARLAILRLQRQAGEWAEVASSLEQLAQHRGGAQAPALLEQAARVYLEHLETPELALVCLKRAIHQADKASRGPLLLATADLLHSMERDTEAAAAFTEARLAAGSEEQAAQALLWLGRLQLERLEEPERGFQSLGAALDLAPSLEPARSLLRAAAADRGDYLTLAAHYRADLERGGSRGQRAGLLLGQLLEGELENPREAVTAYQQTLALRPGWRPALLGLGRAQRAAGEPGLAMATFEAQLLDLQQPEEKIRALEQVAEIAEHELQDLAAAASAHERILSLNPGWAMSRAQLIRLYESLGRWPHLASLLRASVDRTEDPHIRVQLLDHLAWVYTCRLDDPDAALEAHQDQLQLRPDYLPALQGAARILGASGKDEQRLEMLRRLEAVSQGGYPGALATLHAAWTLGSALGQWGEAARLATRLHDNIGQDLGSPHLAALIADLLWACHLRHDPDGVLIKALQQGAPPDDPADAAAWHRRLARGLMVAGEKAEARAHLVSALELEPGATATRRTLAALSALEPDTAKLMGHLERRAAALPPGPEQDEVLHRLLWIQARSRGGAEHSLASLERVTAWTGSPNHRHLLELFLARQQAWPRLATLLGGQPPPPGQGEDEATLSLLLTTDQMMGAALTDTHLDDVEGAAHLAFGVLERHPHNEEALAILERHYRATANAAGLAEILGRRLRGVSHPADKAALQDAVGSTRARGRDHEAAAALFRQAAQTQAVAFSAARNWARASEILQHTEQLCEARAAEASASRVRSHQATATLEAADLWRDALGDAGRAIAAYRQLLRMDPENRAAADSLFQALEQEEQWSALVELLHQEAARDPSRRRSLLKRAAQISLEELGDSEQARDDLLAILKEHPGDAELWADLATACRAAGDWAGLLQADQELLALGPAREDAVALRLELGRVLHERLKRTDEAAEQLNHVLAISPHHKGALRRLVEIHTRQEAWPLASSTIQALLDQEHQRERLVELYLWQARILDVGLNDPPGAMEACRRALAQDPGHIDATRRLADLMGRLGNRSALEHHLRGSLEVHRQRADQDPAALEAYRAMADLFTSLDDPDGARVMGEILEAIAPEEALPSRQPGPPPPRFPAASLTGAPLRALVHPDLPLPLLDLLDRARGTLAKVFPPATAEVPTVSATTSPLQAFEAGGPLSRERLGLTIPAGLGELELGKLVASLLHLTCHLFTPPYPVAELEPLRSNLDRAMDQNTRRALASPGLELSDGAFAPGRWIRAMDYTGDRIGLLLCGSPQVALNCLREKEHHAPGRGQEAGQPGPRSCQLIRFAVGDIYLRLRRQATG